MLAILQFLAIFGGPIGIVALAVFLVTRWTVQSHRRPRATTPPDERPPLRVVS